MRKEQTPHDGGRTGRGRRGPALALPASEEPGPAQLPRLAEGTQLLGEYKDSGYRQPPSLVRRADGQVI